MRMLKIYNSPPPLICQLKPFSLDFPRARIQRLITIIAFVQLVIILSTLVWHSQVFSLLDLYLCMYHHQKMIIYLLSFIANSMAIMMMVSAAHKTQFSTSMNHREKPYSHKKT